MRTPLLILLLTLLAAGCRKTDIAFEDEDDTDDPAVTYYANYPVNLSTYKTDTFITSGHSVFTVGYHRDAYCGNMEGASYTELLLPVSNPLKGQSVLFDSIDLVLVPGGQYYGDTTLPVHLTVHKLTENINNSNEDSRYYNARTFSTETVPLGTKTTRIRPTKDTAIRIRLSDSFGLDLFQKIKSNAAEIQSQSAFRQYLKGIRIGVDTSQTNSLFYFPVPADSMLIQLHYRLNGVTQSAKTLDFNINTALQYNYLFSDRQYSPLHVFTAFKKQLKASALTGHQAVLNSNLGTSIKINIPDLLTLKEKYPYMQVLKAELIIRPAHGTYSYPYTLPESLYLYSTDDGNTLQTLLTDATGQTALSGNLTIDELYGEKTYYSYDITSFIRSVISEGQFSKLALMLTGVSGTTDTKTDRLIINDQTLNQGIQLKLYILGL